jgi:hypothetical protein
MPENKSFNELFDNQLESEDHSSAVDLQGVEDDHEDV